MTLRRQMAILFLAAREAARRLSLGLRDVPLLGPYRGPVPDRLLLAPQDLRTADPVLAQDIYAGRFFLAGHLVETGGADPFRLRDTPVSWQRELHGFQWLRHLDAAAGAINASNAQALIRDWISANPKPGRGPFASVNWEEETAARRLISWIQHSVPIVEQASPEFYRAWLRSIAGHIRYLKKRRLTIKPGMASLLTHVALAYASVCVAGQERNLRNAFVWLDAALQRQILPDGGVLTRNPAHIADMLVVLLPLREVCARQGFMPGDGLAPAMDRLMTALKFHRLGDGSLTRFNGVSATRPEMMATILYYDDALGSPAQDAAHSGFQRLQDGGTIIVADTGMPFAGAGSQTTHAGTLSFEMSTDDAPVMVNCGAPQVQEGASRRLARSTAAHNTATLGDTSSSRFYHQGWFHFLIGGRLIDGPSNVACERRDSSEGKGFAASHDGYLRSHGVRHARQMRIVTGGRRVEGIDRFATASGTPVAQARSTPFAIRFHLHPSVSAGFSQDRHSIILMCAGGIAWRFTCIDCAMEIEESIYFASPSGNRRTRQIVLTGNTAENPEVRWLMERQF